MASSQRGPESERHHPRGLGLGARRRAPKDGSTRHAAAPHTRHRRAGPATKTDTPGDTAQSSSSPAAKDGGDGNYTIAVVPKDATNPWFVRMETGVKKYAADTGMNVFQKGPAETDATMQAQVIQDLIAQGVDAICVVPVDPGAIEPVLKQAMDAGIVVVTHEGASQ